MIYYLLFMMCLELLCDKDMTINKVIIWKYSRIIYD